jgi:hypothetical protein
MLLLIEIGPPADLSVKRLRNLSQPLQPIVFGTLKENVTPSSVTVILRPRGASMPSVPAGAGATTASSVVFS